MKSTVTVYQLLTMLGDAGIKLWVEEGELRFRAPKGALTPGLRDQIVSHKPELIQFLQQSRSGEVVKQRKIEAVSRSVPLPLSFGQERLWFLSQLEKDSSAYHIPILLELNGVMKPARLEAALDALIDRHEILRTVIVATENTAKSGYLQRVLPRNGSLDKQELDGQVFDNRDVDKDVDKKGGLRFEDIRHLGEVDKELLRLKLIEATRSTSFILEKGPLLRTVLIQLADERYQLILTLHHIITDGWSMSVLVRELIALYLGQTLPPLAIQYGDYAHWQRQWLSSNEREQQLTFWCNHLEAVPVLELPLDKSRPAALRPRGDAHFFSWPLSLQEKVSEFSQQAGSTVFMTMLAVFEILLSRYSGQNDFAVGTPIANRTMPEQEPLIGFFVNTLALRAKVDPQQSFESLLKVVQRSTLEAYAHQDLPFEQVVEALNVSREMSYTPLFQVMFSLQNESDIGIELPGLKVVTLPLSRRSSKCDLNLTLTETPEGFRGELEYNTTLFNPETIVRMESQLQQLLKNVLAAPQAPLQKISLLSDSLRHQILGDWNAQTLPVAEVENSGYGLAALFEAQVLQQPDAVALQHGSQQLSYEMLNLHANVYAQSLLKAGVKADQVVALCGPRSLERIVGLLAIVKVGAVYMPLETNLPAERLAVLMSQGEAAWSIVAEQQAEGFERLATQCLPYPQLTENQPCAENPGIPAQPEQRAYIMFTSGSTGEPKGIAIPQRGIVRLVKNNGFLTLEPDTCLLHYAPLAFDASTFEIWGALLNGGKLVVAQPGMLELEQLGDEISSQGVNTLWLTAALFHSMVENHPTSLAPLRTLLAGGDQLNPHCVRSLLYRYPSLTLINGYGPTENTTFTCCHVMQSADQVGRSVSIGKAINHTQVYVLNEALEPQAVGVPGELCTAGQGVALGYLQSDQGVSTGAGAFISNPFAEEFGHGPVLYRTGDQVRYLSDGSLEFLGRIDQQVKIRGFRIELGEIEAALTSLPWVTGSVVRVQEKNQQKYLVAYLEVDVSEGSVSQGNVSEAKVPEVNEAQQAALVQRSRSQLSRLLPDYMQPTAYQVVTSLPVTRNGKVDRKALPEISFGGSASADGAPSTKLESELLSIWQAVLNVDAMGVHDNFFELGGHSLLATQVTSRVRKKLGFELPVREMFTSPTIAQCAQWLSVHGSQNMASKLGELVKREAASVVPATYAQRRLWLLEQLSPGSSAYLIPSALRIRGPLDMVCVNQVVNTLIARHESLRTAIIEDKSTDQVVLCQQVSESLTVEIERESCAESASPTTLQGIINEEAKEGFDLTRAPLMRMRFVALDNDPNKQEDTLLLLTMHHIISDGWSMSVFINEFTALYEAFRKAQESPLPAAALQYGDYACWQARWLDDARLQTSLDFWLGHISDKDPVLHLPTDFQRPSTPSSPGAMCHRTLPVPLSQGLLALSEREDVSLFMLALSTWQLLLSRYSGQQRFNVGSPVAGRTLAETESMIGFFINTVVFGANVDENLSFREFLYQVREQSLDGFTHQHLPFEMLVDALQPERSLRHSPLFQVFINVLNLPPASREVADLLIEDLSDEQQDFSAKFDLTLYVQPQEEGLKLSMLYRSDCFQAESIDRHLAQLETLFAQVVHDLDRPLAAFRLLQEDDKAVLPKPQRDFPHIDFPLPQDQISERAGSQAETTALVDMDGAWSYLDLETRSNQLADALIKGGLKQEAPVVIYGHRSGALVCAILAIIKAGGAFSVLDPAHPEASLLAAIDALQPHGVLALERAGPLSEKLSAVLPQGPLQLAVPALGTWQENNPFAAYSGARLVPQPDHLNQLSYLMLSSGTSGRFKVIRGSLRPIAALLDWYPRSFSVSNEDRFSLFSGLGHDPLLRDIFVPLSLGATLLIPAPDLMKKPGPLRQWMIDNQISVSHLTPALAQLITQDGDQSPACESLRYMLFSGDKLAAENLAPVRAFASKSALINCYGCTETPQIHSWYRINDGEHGLVPVGQGSEYSQLLLMDKRQCLAGIGEMAEVFVHSPYLALGYDDAVLSEQAFIPNPFSGALNVANETLMYRTGDYGRYRADGSVEILGRKDFQVKIRGYRVELEEISACIQSITHVNQVVTCYEVMDEQGQTPQLIAYLCASQEQALNKEQLREEIRQRLPDYMLPNDFVVVADIPLTPNGKLDRKALRQRAAEQAKPFRAPETDTEITLASLWSEVLHHPAVGVNENFFALGGQSLLATQLLARVKSHFNVELPLKLVFELTTIETMAEYIDTALWVRDDASQGPTDSESDWEELEL
ncbi:MAG: amino acid adenylation domain-containing protein [Gammaproteobacteria bacterium]|nr:amino acid adenylation domain-containing protein [Gammaproteobacteria bacterium]